MDTQAVSRRTGRKPRPLPERFLTDTILLLPKGAKVSYRHYRYIRQAGKPKLIRFMRNDLHPADPLPRGGKTECTLQVDGQFFRGVAVCSQSDVFSYRMGAFYAFCEALRAYRQVHPIHKASGASA
jgi:hypothetical protein